jgi:hypothetical protein
MQKNFIHFLYKICSKMRNDEIFDNCRKKNRKTDMLWMRCTPTTRIYQSRFREYHNGGVITFISLQIKVIAPHFYDSRYLPAKNHPIKPRMPMNVIKAFRLVMPTYVSPPRAKTPSRNTRARTTPWALFSSINYKERNHERR